MALTDCLTLPADDKDGIAMCLLLQTMQQHHSHSRDNKKDHEKQDVVEACWPFVDLDQFWMENLSLIKDEERRT